MQRKYIIFGRFNIFSNMYAPRINKKPLKSIINIIILMSKKVIKNNLKRERVDKVKLRRTDQTLLFH